MKTFELEERRIAFIDDNKFEYFTDFQVNSFKTTMLKTLLMKCNKICYKRCGDYFSANVVDVIFDSFVNIPRSYSDSRFVVHYLNGQACFHVTIKNIKIIKNIERFFQKIKCDV